MKALELIENEIGNTHDNPNIDNKCIADMMDSYAEQRVKEERERIMNRLRELFHKDSMDFLNDFIIDLMSES